MVVIILLTADNLRFQKYNPYETLYQPKDDFNIYI